MSRRQARISTTMLRFRDAMEHQTPIPRLPLIKALNAATNLFTDYWDFIHSGYFCNASSSPLLLRGASDTARIPCRNFTPKRHRQLRMKNLSKVPTCTWRLERDSNPRPFGRMTQNLPMSRHAPQMGMLIIYITGCWSVLYEILA